MACQVNYMMGTMNVSAYLQKVEGVDLWQEVYLALTRSQASALCWECLQPHSY